MSLVDRKPYLSRRRFLTGTAAFALLSACSSLPASGPQSRDISADAAVKLTTSDESQFKYVLVNLSKTVLDVLSDTGPGSFFRSFGTGRGGPPEVTVGVGDAVQVTIFESAAGGLFIPSDAGARAGNFVQLPVQTVDQKGFITVPYAGAIAAKGKTLQQVQNDIVLKLANRAIEPQVIITLTNQVSSQVTVIGQVGSPNKININPAGDRVLDILSRSGGITNPGYETFVTLQRNGKKATNYFLNLVTKPEENVFVSVGDTLYVYQEQRAFTVFGASGTSGQFKFQQEHVLLNEAVGKAGGLLDARADPGEVFLYRLEAPERLREMQVDITGFSADAHRIPVIYRTNFRDPSSFFLASNFYVQNNDVIYVSNADQVELSKFLTLLLSLGDTVGTLSSDAVATTSAIRPLYRR